MENSQVQQEKVIVINKIDPRLLFGVNDENLKILEKQFPIQIISRGNQLKLIGDPEVLDQVEDVISELIFIGNKNKNITPEDVETVIHVIKADVPRSVRAVSGEVSEQKKHQPARELEEVILFTKRGYVKPRTPGQRKIVEAVRNNDIVVIIGPAGTGKTYLAVALAVAALKNKEVNKIVLARPAVEAGESLGFLPGDYREKIDPYLRPLYDALEEMLPRELLKKYMEQGIIEVIPLAYMRGRTLNNSFVILDEAQNATSMQMKMFLTRLGINSRAIINGDITQVDLPTSAASGLIEIQNILQDIEGISFVYLDKSDVVRHRLVRDIIHAYGEHKKSEKEGKE